MLHWTCFFFCKPDRRACCRSSHKGQGTEAQGRHGDIPTFSCTGGQQAGSGFLSDSQISSALALILPRRNFVGTDHRCNTLDAIAGNECHAALPLGHALSAGTTCGHLTKCSRERCGREETETRLSSGPCGCAIHGWQQTWQWAVPW